MNVMLYHVKEKGILTMNGAGKTNSTFQLQPAGACPFARKAVFVSVTKALSGEAPDIAPGMPLADIARGFWHVNNNKIKQCELLVAVERGIIRGIWEIDTAYGWHPMSATAIPTHDLRYIVVDPSRKYCQIKREVLSDFKNKKLLHINGMVRMRGPIQYNF